MVWKKTLFSFFFFFLENIPWKSCQNIAETCRLMSDWENMSKFDCLPSSLVWWGHKISQQIPRFEQMRWRGKQHICNPICMHAVMFWVGIAVQLFHLCVLWIPSFGQSWYRVLNYIGLGWGLNLLWCFICTLCMTLLTYSPEVQLWLLLAHLLLPSGCSSKYLTRWLMLCITGEHPEMRNTIQEHQCDGEKKKMKPLGPWWEHTEYTPVSHKLHISLKLTTLR